MLDQRMKSDNNYAQTLTNCIQKNIQNLEFTRSPSDPGKPRPHFPETPVVLICFFFKASARV